MKKEYVMISQSVVEQWHLDLDEAMLHLQSAAVNNGGHCEDDILKNLETAMVNIRHCIQILPPKQEKFPF